MRSERESESPRLDLMVDLPLNAFPMRSEPLWLPAGLLAALLTLTMAIGAIGAPVQNGSSNSGATRDSARSSLQWRSVSRPAPTSQPAPKKRLAIRDSQVRQTAFGDDLYAAPSVGGRASVQGFVEVDSAHNDSAHFDAQVRVAQAAEPDFGSELERALSEPFGAEELPPQEEGDLIESGSSLEDDSLQEGPDPFEGQSLPEVDPMPELEEPTPADNEPDTLELPPLEPSPSDNEFNGSQRNGGREPNTFQPGRNEGPDDTEIEPLKVPPLERDATGQQRREEEAEETEAQQKARKDCADELAKLKASRLSSVDIHIGVTGEVGKDYPFNCSIDDGTPFVPRCWPQVTYMWKASGLCHKPLYFEQTHLERYGHSWGPYLDPVVSGAHFFTRFPVLPYCMGLKAPTECVYTLGHYRPGSCAPYMIEQPGVTRRAILFEMGAWTGGVFAIP